MENVSSRCGKSDNAPRLRFPEFRGKWVEKKLGEIFFEVNERKHPELPVLSIQQGIGTVFRDISERRISYDKANINAYKVIEPGDFIIHLRSFEGGLECSKHKGISSPAYKILRSNCIDSAAFKDYFRSYNFIEGKLAAAVTGIRDGKNIDMPTFWSLKINIPSLPEQKKIAAFFTLLDRRIQKQRQFVEYLKTYKRGVSEAIFERKFGFPNKTNWKKIKIENLFSERCERAIGNEELLAVTINGGIQKRNEIQLKDNSSEDKSNYKRVHIGDIAYNTMRMWQGASGVSCYAGIVSPAYTVIVLKDKENQCIDFWGHYFKHTNLIRTFQKFSQGLTSDTWNLKYAQLSQINLYVPEYKEQCAIANFLHKFDSKISIEEKKLSQLSMLKNELLHRMFI